MAMQMYRCNGNGNGNVRQLVAGLLTLSMFLLMLLPNIIQSSSSPSPSPSLLHAKVQDHMLVVRTAPGTSTGTGTGTGTGAAAAFALQHTNTLLSPSLTLTPCWPISTSQNTAYSKGFITFSLTIGPESHISQVTDAVVIARYLGATLALPDIRGNEVGQTRNFQDIYDVDKFISALTGIIKVTKELPADMATRQPAVLRIKNRVSEYNIEKQIQPVFRRNNYLRLALTYQSTSLEQKQQYTNKQLLATACVAMFQSLELQPKLREVGDRIIAQLRELDAKSNGEFVAVDLRLDVLGKSNRLLDGVAGMKRCYNASEVASFLKKAGFGEETVVYLTETWWHESLNPLKDSFPKTYTKDDIIPAEKTGQFLKSGNQDLAKVLDIHVCSKSDTFVAAIDGPFYSHVSGRRIASGRTHILLPPQDVSGERAQESDFVSPFVSKKSHAAYSCYC